MSQHGLPQSDCYYCSRVNVNIVQAYPCEREDRARSNSEKKSWRISPRGRKKKDRFSRCNRNLASSWKRRPREGKDSELVALASGKRFAEVSSGCARIRFRIRPLVPGNERTDTETEARRPRKNSYDESVSLCLVSCAEPCVVSSRLWCTRPMDASLNKACLRHLVRDACATFVLDVRVHSRRKVSRRFSFYSAFVAVSVFWSEFGILFLFREHIFVWNSRARDFLFNNRRPHDDPKIFTLENDSMKFEI